MYDYIDYGMVYGPRVTEFSDKFTRGLHRYRVIQSLWRSDESSDIAANRCAAARNRYSFSHRKS